MFQNLPEFAKRYVILFLVIAITLAACAPNIERLQERGNIEKLIDALDFERDPDVRADAARALGELGADEALEPLLTLLSDDEVAEVRSAAAKALGQIDGSRVIQPLIDALEDRSSIVKNSAEEGLALCGERAVDPMIALLGSDDEGLHQSAVDVLSGIGSPAAAPLIGLLLSPDMDVRTGAYDALVNMGHPAVSDLLASISSDEKALNYIIVKILVEIGADAVHPLISLLNDDDEYVTETAVEALGKIGSPAVAPLINSLVDDSRRNYVHAALLEVGEPAIDPLIEALSDPDLQIPAGDVLVDMGEAAINPLLEAYEVDPENVENYLRPLTFGLTVDDIQVRQRVMDILEEIGEPAIPAIMNMVKNANKIITGGQTFIVSAADYSPYGTVEGTLVNGGLCTEVGNWVGKIVLCQRGESYFSEKVKQVEAGGGIAVVHYNSIEGNMWPMLYQEDEYNSVSVGVSQEIGETLIENYLGETVIVSSRDISSAQEILEDFGDIAIPYLVEYIKDEEIRWTSSFYLIPDVLIAMGSPAVPATIEMLNDNDEDIRYEAAYILGQIDDDRVVDPLIEALEDSSTWVRKQAAYSLGERQAVEAIEPLMDLLDDEDEYVRTAAAEALQGIGLPAVDYLLDIYHGEDAQKKESAASALLAIFKANEAAIKEVAVKVCSGQAQTKTTEYRRYEGDYHPTVILDSDGNVHSWTYDLAVDWLPYTPEQLELVVCLGDLEKNSIQVCPYYKPGTYTYVFSITRYRYKRDAALYSSFTGYRLNATTLWGSYPDSCPYSAYSSQSQITGSTITVSDLATWLSSYGIPLGE